MELFITIQRVLWVAEVLAEALIVIRFLREGLFRGYPFFVTYLTVEVIASIALMQIDLKSRSYAEAYRACELILTVFRLGVAIELYQTICQHFPGIGKFRTVMAAVLVFLAALFAFLSFQPSIAGQWAFPQTVTIVVLRFEAEILGVALILTWLFLRYVLSIRQPFRPNVLTHWTIATIYFGSTALGYLIALFSGAGKVVYPINCAMLVVQIACFFAWFILMRRSGEELPAFPRLSPDQVQAVENYQRELLRTVRSLPGQISARQAEDRDIPLHRARPL